MAVASEVSAPSRPLQGRSYADILASSEAATRSDHGLGESKFETPLFPQRVRGTFPDYPESFSSSSRQDSALRGSGYRSTTSYSAEVSGSGYWTTDEGSQQHQTGEGYLDSRVRFRPALSTSEFVSGTSGSSHTYDASGSGYWSTE